MGRTSRKGSSSTLAEIVRNPRVRLPSKRQLEIQISKLAILSENPSLQLEQYPVSGKVAAEILYMAGFDHSDITHRDVLDLGTGTGRLAIGAALMQARRVVGVDVDRRSLEIAKANAVLAQVDVDWEERDIASLEDRFDTVVMNPPYGTRQRHADTAFLQRALELAPVVYSIHKSSTRRFLQDYVSDQGRRLDEVRTMEMDIPHLHEFHRKKSKAIRVDLLRIAA